MAGVTIAPPLIGAVWPAARCGPRPAFHERDGPGLRGPGHRNGQRAISLRLALFTDLWRVSASWTIVTSPPAATGPF